MDKFLTVSANVDGANVNIMIKLELNSFTPFILAGLTAIAKAGRIPVVSPESLSLIFQRGLELPEIHFIYRNSRRSAMTLIKTIPDDIKAASLSPTPVGQPQVDSTIEYLVNKSSNISFPLEVKVCIAKLIVLFYIQQVGEILAKPIKEVISQIQSGVNPVKLVDRIPWVTLSSWSNNTYTFITTGSFDYYGIIRDEAYMGDKYSLYVNSLPRELKESLFNYTTSQYKDINTYLRTGSLSGKSASLEERTIQNIANIDQAFLNAEPLMETLTLYRGQEEEIFDTKGFTSTTYNVGRTSNFVDGVSRCCMYVITVLPGSKILPLAVLSEEPSEAEVLLDRKARFVITKTEMKTYNFEEETLALKTIYLTYMPENTTEIVTETGPSSVITE